MDFKAIMPQMRHNNYFLQSFLQHFLPISEYSGQYPYTAVSKGINPISHHQHWHTNPNTKNIIAAIINLIVLSKLLILYPFLFLSFSMYHSLHNHRLH